MATEKVGSVTVTFKANISPLKRELQTATDRMARLDTRIKTTRKNVQSLSTAAMDAGNSVEDFNSSVTSTATNLSSLRDWADKTQGSMSQISQGFEEGRQKARQSAEEFEKVGEAAKEVEKGAESVDRMGRSADDTEGFVKALERAKRDLGGETNNYEHHLREVERRHQESATSLRDFITSLRDSRTAKAAVSSVTQRLRSELSGEADETRKMQALKQAYAEAQRRITREADNQTNAKRKLRAEMRSLVQQMNQAQSQSAGLAGTLQNVGNSLRSAASAAQSIAPSFTTVRRLFYDAVRAGRAVVNNLQRLYGAAYSFGKEAVQAFAEFEESMKRTGAVADVLGKDIFPRMKRQARDLSTETVFAAQEIGEGMRFMAMSGLEAHEVMTGIPDVLDLATTAIMDIGKAAEISTNIMVGYGKEAEDLTKVVDVMAATMTSANTDVQDLGKGMEYAAPVASHTGIQFEEAAASLAMFADAGVSGGRAGRTLRNILSRLQSPTAQAQQRMDELGMSVRDAEGNLKDIAGIVDEFARAEAMDPGAAVDILQQRAGTGILSLIERGSDDLREFTAMLEDAEGTASDLANEIEESLSARIKIFNAQVNEAQITIGQGFMPAVHDVLDLFDKWSGWFNENESMVQDWARDSATGLVKFLRAVGKTAAKTVGYIILVVDRLAGAVEATKGALGTTLAGAGKAWGTSLQAVGWGTGIDPIQEFGSIMSEQADERAEESMDPFVDGLERVLTGTEEAEDATEMLGISWAAADKILETFEDGLGETFGSTREITEEIERLEKQLETIRDMYEGIKQRRDDAADRGDWDTVGRLQGDEERAAKKVQEIEEDLLKLKEQRGQMEEYAAEEREKQNQYQEDQEQAEQDMVDREAVRLEMLQRQNQRRQDLLGTEEEIHRRYQDQAWEIEQLNEGLEEAAKLRENALDHAEEIAEHTADAVESTAEGIASGLTPGGDEASDGQREVIENLEHELSLAQAGSDVERARIEYAHERARILDEVENAEERRLRLQLLTLEYAEDLTEQVEAQTRHLEEADAVLAGLSDGFEPMARQVAREQDQQLSEERLRREMAMAETTQERLRLEQRLYDMQRAEAVEAADAQVQAYGNVADALRDVIEVQEEFVQSSRTEQDEVARNIGMMSAMSSVASSAASSFTDDAQQTLRTQAIINGVMAATSLGYFLFSGNPQYLAAALQFGATAAGKGISASKAGGVPEARQIDQPMTDREQEDSTKEAIKDALEELGLTGDQMGRQENNYYTYDPVAQDRRDVQAQRLKERSERAELLSTGEDDG